MRKFDFKVVVFVDGAPKYIDGSYPDLRSAQRRVVQMANISGIVDGERVFAVDGDDDLVIVDGGGQVVSVWHRFLEKTVESFADFDFSAFHAECEAREAVRLVGFRIENCAGVCIHGTEDDPFNLSQSDILTDSAVLTAKGWADNTHFIVKEVWSADPTLYNKVTHISEPGNSPRPF
ncbi:hypothetical protein [Thalassospira xiamenensis]|uniref:Uncharacterized protein n=1 Tax=Thalassospira xiamenensis TaxID=220697 RepID=A0A285TU40_9PROT|nr:hypothetical protein [Thalassospira xiamenensis]SOC27506.1 hypothetical protein SAMN05428964_105442 [Thalassospira xiamenensis]